MSSIFDIYRTVSATAEATDDGHSHRLQAKPTARMPVRRWAYPFAPRDKTVPDTMRSHFQAIASMTHGFFPLNVNGYPNGSLHFGKECKDAFDYDAGFRCIADGEVIAYRLDENLHLLDYGPESDQRVIEYSLGFVLVRHWLPLPPAPAAEKEGTAGAKDEGIYLYSLYSYNRPLSDYRSITTTMRKDTLPFWQGERVFRVGDGCKDVQELPPPPPPWVSGDHAWNDLPPPEPPPSPLYERPPVVGRRVRAAGHKDAEILAILPRGTEITVEGNRTRGWAQLRSIRMDNPQPAVKGGRVPPEAERGWVFLTGMDSCIDPTPDTLDRVVVLDTPYPVKAGERLGYLGENPALRHAAKRRTTMFREPAMALEVFAGEDFPAYLAQARERAARLPDAEKSVLTVEAQAKGIFDLFGDDRLLSTQVLVPDTDSPPGAFVRGKRYNVVPTPVGAMPKPGEPAKKTSGFRCSADGWERIEAAKFAQLSPAEQAKYPCEEVLELVNERPVWGRRGAAVNRQHDLWDTFPLSIDRAILAPIPFAMAIPRSELEALPPERKTTDPNGVRWWKIDISVQNGTEKAWVAEKGMPGVSWQSPHAWPAFTVVDGSSFSLLEAFQRHAVITGKVHPAHEQSFTATTHALAHNDMIVQLERAIDDSGEKDGRITGADIGAARTKPLLANALSRMIVRFESQWSTDQDRWAALDDIMRHEWKAERERQTKRGWWNDVASRIDSFPQDPRVYHIHPFGWIDNFHSRQRSIDIDKFIDAYKPRHGALGVFERTKESPNGVITKVPSLNEESERNLRRLVLTIVSLYEEQGEVPYIPHMAYMLATVRHESYNYRKQIFFSTIEERISREDAERDYGSGKNARSEAYRKRAKDNGNTEDGDGYKYRGRGFVQLTWKRSYKKHSERLGVDLVSNPDLANDWDVAARIMFDGMRQALFRKRSSLYTHINEGRIDYVAARDIINGRELGVPEAIAGFAKAFEECLRDASR